MISDSLDHFHCTDEHAPAMLTSVCATEETPVVKLSHSRLREIIETAARDAVARKMENYFSHGYVSESVSPEKKSESPD